ncbi:HEPN domain-containing protein [Modestobacter sp. VKM Ac-2984]|uniref:HEPN domain-containing protein n=1 Tax=Modestobacter sp. VKM Ac-2984 TaxID=3004138 RepID=UPI0022AAE643|nr:HEPN domain-containing protein [Modestobacter sp. VKM Ac-2984]MCZ2814920.1 HEPN domain-containing protein [Modestobacter sp. VKM Ac-2984]
MVAEPADAGTDDQLIKAHVVTTGFVREGDPDAHHPQFVPNVVGELHRVWIDAELSARGDAAPAAVAQALIVLPLSEGGDVEVRLNDEVDFVAVAGEDAQVVDPTDVFVGQITNLWPTNVHPDAAWSCFVTAQEGRVVVFDFRRNREAVGAVIERARQFWRSAQLNLGHEDQLPPAVEDLHAAAELAILVMALLGGWQQPKNQGQRHRGRHEWLKGQVRYGDTPAEYLTTFDRLAEQRNVARYAERPLAIDQDEAQQLLGIVEAMIDEAERLRS